MWFSFCDISSIFGRNDLLLLGFQYANLSHNLDHFDIDPVHNNILAFHSGVDQLGNQGVEEFQSGQSHIVSVANIRIPKTEQ